MSSKPHKVRIYPGPGFRIRKGIARPAPELCAGFGAYAVQDISDLLNGLYALAPGIRNLVNDRPLIGPACTVKLPAGDNLMLHKALDLAAPGDVLVVDARGGDFAVCGDLICQKAVHRGIAGLVIDGLIRDLPGLQTLGLPVFARGLTPVAPRQHGPGEINYPVSCGGVVIQPGDLIVADQNGIVAIPQDCLPDLLERLSDWQKDFNVYHREVEAGHFDNAWADALLEQAGVEYRD